MIGEIDIAGVFVQPLVVWAVIALFLHLALRRGLTWIGAYRIVWRRPLFDLALFVMLWAGVAALSSRLSLLAGSPR
jgi:hypothetical protein